MGHQITSEGGADLGPAAPHALSAAGGGDLGPTSPGAVVAAGGGDLAPGAPADLLPAAAPDAGLLVTGTLSPDATGFLREQGTLGGKPAYSKNGEAITGLPSAGNDTQAFWDAGLPGWTLAFYAEVELAGAWTSTEDVATPDLVVTWTPFGASTGTPVFTPGGVAAPPTLTPAGTGDLAPSAPHALTPETIY